MFYAIIILMSLIEAMFVWSLWYSIKTGRVPVKQGNPGTVHKKFRPASYWLWVTVVTLMIFLVVPYMTLTLISGAN